MISTFWRPRTSAFNGKHTWKKNCIESSALPKTKGCVVCPIMLYNIFSEKCPHGISGECALVSIPTRYYSARRFRRHVHWWHRQTVSVGLNAGPRYVLAFARTADYGTCPFINIRHALWEAFEWFLLDMQYHVQLVFWCEILVQNWTHVPVRYLLLRKRP